MPIYEGYALPFATTDIPICGRDLTKFMHDMLMKKNSQLITDSTEGRDEAEKVKIMHGKVALDYDAEMKAANDSSSAETTYKLPGGQTIYLREERLKCAELLFSPSINGITNSRGQPVEDGIHKYTYDAIIKCD